MQERYLATADLGSSKIAITVAKISGNDIEVVYYRESPSDGIRHSSVFNPKRASESLGKAISMAENELKIKIMQLVLGLPRYEVRQEIASARLERSDDNSCITHEEVHALKSMALDSYPLEDATKEEIYGAVAQSFTADDLFQQSEHDIVGSTASFLEGNFKIFVGAKKNVKNIDIMLNELGIAPARKVFLPHATASAVLTDEEKDNGVALIEIGAGVTSLSIYKGRILRYYGAIPFGGSVITSDIKYECGFKESLAENVKLAFGACLPEKLQSMSEKILQINDEESGTYEHLPVKYLSEIISSRAREIVEAILFLIQESGFAEKLRNGIVITGGGANLANLSILIKEMSGYNVRVGYPRAKRIINNGFSRINETSAVSSIGLLLAASRDEHLNCINEAPKKHSDEEDTAEVIAEGSADISKEDIKPVKDKKKYKFSWTKKVAKTLNGLFDEMQ